MTLVREVDQGTKKTSGLKNGTHNSRDKRTTGLYLIGAVLGYYYRTETA